VAAEEGRWTVSADGARTGRGRSAGVRHPPETRARAVELRAAGRSIREIAAELGVNKSTVERWLAAPAVAAAVERITEAVAVRVEEAAVDRLAAARIASQDRLLGILPDAEEALGAIVRDADADPHARLRGIAMVQDRVLGKIPSPDKAGPAAIINVNHPSAREVAAVLDARPLDELRAAAYGNREPAR
jgi:transposase-like protein